MCFGDFLPISTLFILRNLNVISFHSWTFLFIKGWAPGKSYGCQDDFAHLHVVWPSSGKYLYKKSLGPISFAACENKFSYRWKCKWNFIPWVLHVGPRNCEQALYVVKVWLTWSVWRKIQTGIPWTFSVERRLVLTGKQTFLNWTSLQENLFSRRLKQGVAGKSSLNPLSKIPVLI